MGRFKNTKNCFMKACALSLYMTTIRATRHTSEGGKAFRIYAAYSGSPEEVQVFKRSFKGARRQEDRLTSAVGGGGGGREREIMQSMMTMKKMKKREQNPLLERSDADTNRKSSQPFFCSIMDELVNDPERKGVTKESHIWTFC